MAADLELTLSFDGECWSTVIDGHTFSAAELPELENRIAQAVRHMARFQDHPCVQVWLGFDFDVIPTWLRQYHSHYFNSRLQVTMPSANAELPSVT